MKYRHDLRILRTLRRRAEIARAAQLADWLEQLEQAQRDLARVHRRATEVQQCKHSQSKQPSSGATAGEYARRALYRAGLHRQEMAYVGELAAACQKITHLEAAVDRARIELCRATASREAVERYCARRQDLERTARIQRRQADSPRPAIRSFAEVSVL